MDCSNIVTPLLHPKALYNCLIHSFTHTLKADGGCCHTRCCRAPLGATSGESVLPKHDRPALLGHSCPLKQSEQYTPVIFQLMCNVIIYNCNMIFFRMQKHFISFSEESLQKTLFHPTSYQNSPSSICKCRSSRSEGSISSHSGELHH